MVQAPDDAALKRAKTVMITALGKGDINPVLQIVKFGFPVDDPIMDCGVNLLMHVAAARNLTAGDLQKILELNPDLNVRDSIGRTALHFACRAGEMERVQLLAEHDDCDVDVVTKSGVSPLMMAVESGKMNVVVACLNSNLNPFLKDALERNAFDYAQHYRDVLG